MPRPTTEQLRRINQFSHTELSADQVYVFRSLSADTLPVSRYGWYGEYSINMASTMLNALKKSYQAGVGLLASHNNNRLPFGRTFDAEVTVDHVNSMPVETMYIDQFIVTHTKDEEGNSIPLRTEINGMTTQDIVNHIDVGHTFDTSIGFSITEPTCSICKNDIRDYTQCSHIPGKEYDVQVGEDVVQVRCNIIANDGEGLENSLVYAGAVDRAIITNGRFSASENLSENLQGSVNNGEPSLYNVDDIKTVPLHSQILCKMSKGNMELFTTTSERKDISQLKGSADMPTENITETGENTEGFTTIQARDVVSLEEYNKVIGDKELLSKDLEKLQSTNEELTEKLAKADTTVAELTVKSELADKFTKDLVESVVKAGVQARGNGFNKERYAKYAESLTVDELKEELQAFKQEFPGSVEEARVTAVELETDRNDETVNLTVQEMRELAARNAMEIYKTKGGNLEELTKNELANLQSKSKSK